MMNIFYLISFDSFVDNFNDVILFIFVVNYEDVLFVVCNVSVSKECVILVLFVLDNVLDSFGVNVNGVFE